MDKFKANATSSGTFFLDLATGVSVRQHTLSLVTVNLFRILFHKTYVQDS